MEDTLPKLLKRNYERWGDREVAFRDKEFGIWNEYTWKDSYENVKYLSLGLISLGLQPGDKVAIIGDNEPQWYWASFAVQAARGITVAMFTDAIPNEIEYIVNHSDSKFIVARDQEQIDKILLIWDKLTKVEKIIYWYYRGMRKYDQPFLLRFDQVLDMGRKYEETHPGLFEENIAQGKGDDLANIYYTSGTTGLPKGAMITHAALIGSTNSMLSLCPVTEKDNILCYLPPAWIGEAFFGFVPHLLTGAKLNTLEEPETVFTDIREICPVMILGGPRQWEGWVSMIKARIDEAGGIERFLFNLLMPIALRIGKAKLAGGKVNPLWKALYPFVDWILLRAIRDRLGLTKARFAATAGTVIGMDTFSFFHGLGINLRQVYGSTEGGIISGQKDGEIRLGTVGTALPGVEVKISEEGEILVKSPYHFSGYYKNPEATEKAFKDGWWLSGDAGYIDEKGHIVFLDRVSEMAKLRSGVGYAPQYIESSLRYSPYIKDAMTVGDEERDYISVIVNIDFENVGRWAERNRVAYTTFTDLSQKPEVGELIGKEVDRVNKTLPASMRIKKYVLLHKEFDPDEADLTRTRKLRRAAMVKRYKEVIDAIYQDREKCPIESTVVYEDGRTGKVTADLTIYTVKEAVESA